MKFFNQTTDTKTILYPCNNSDLEARNVTRIGVAGATRFKIYAIAILATRTKKLEKYL